MIAPHREHAGNRTRSKRARSIDRKHDDPLSFVILIPQLGMTSIPIHVDAEIPVLGDLADGVSRLVDSARDDSSWRSFTDAFEDVAGAIPRPSARRAED